MPLAALVASAPETEEAGPDEALSVAPETEFPPETEEAGPDEAMSVAPELPAACDLEPEETPMIECTPEIAKLSMPSLIMQTW